MLGQVTRKRLRMSRVAFFVLGERQPNSSFGRPLFYSRQNIPISYDKYANAETTCRCPQEVGLAADEDRKNDGTRLRSCNP